MQEINILKVTSYDTQAEAENLVARGELAATILIPADFSQLLDCTHAHTRLRSWSIRLNRKWPALSRGS